MIIPVVASQGFTGMPDNSFKPRSEVRPERYPLVTSTYRAKRIAFGLPVPDLARLPARAAAVVAAPNAAWRRSHRNGWFTRKDHS